MFSRQTNDAFVKEFSTRRNEEVDEETGAEDAFVKDFSTRRNVLGSVLAVDERSVAGLCASFTMFLEASDNERRSTRFVRSVGERFRRVSAGSIESSFGGTEQSRKQKSGERRFSDA